MPDDRNETEPDNTAVRVALWRALHVLIDPPPHVLEDEIGLQLVAPDPGWRSRPDMEPNFTSRFRAAIVARARFVEDLVVEQAGQGVSQYIILGAGLDTFAQRRPEIASRLQVFEIDQPGTQAWKRRRLHFNLLQTFAQAGRHGRLRAILREFQQSRLDPFRLLTEQSNRCRGNRDGTAGNDRN